MDEAKAALAELRSALDYDALAGRLADITTESEQGGFWDDHEKAQKLLKERKAVEDKVKGYDALAAELDDVEVMLALADEENDESLVPEIQESYEKWNKDIDNLRVRTLLGDEYDLNNAYVEINAGAGGTDAQDWAEMLLRMYMRWAERRGYKTKMLDLQDDTVAGIKSARFFVEGEYAYGYLKSEKGVHRLVRISPFDAAHRRHTSFASVGVSPELPDDVEVDIRAEDLRVDTFRASGAGGQYVNRTDSAVRITHIPSGIVVSCQNERSQHMNRQVAMNVLKSRLYERAMQERSDELAAVVGDKKESTWGSQIRSYVLHPYTLVKDHRTGTEKGNVQGVLDGDIDEFIMGYLRWRKNG
jgi:peptide chain release factor 2